jgi:dolichol-phosphate mannosyltransferase
MNKKILVSVVIPVYNEQNLIKKLLRKVNSVKNIKKEIIIVNDGSTDKTSEIIKKECKNLFNLLINCKINKGKGHACRLGIKKAKGEIIIIQDGDLEYNPKNYPRLIKPILQNQSKVVYGSRVLKGAKRTRPKTISFVIRIFANHFLTFLSNIINNQNLTDAHTCYKVFSHKILKKIILKEDGFNFCPEITTKISKLNLKIIEVPIDYFGRTVDEGKKIQFFDGFRAIYCLLKYRFL